jgi:hypothetical protein
VPAASGYSGTPLARKLGIAIVAFGRAPIPAAHVFVTRRAELDRRLTRLRKALDPGGFVWVSWPRRTARVDTDVTEDVIRAVALPLGFVDIKVCAVSEVWSGLKLVVRVEQRGRA